MNKLITQEEPMGCGIACVAVALDKSYQSAKKLFDNPEYASSRGYYCRELINALNKRRANYTFSKINGKNKNLLKRSLQNCLNFSKRSLKERNLAFLEAANFAKRFIQTSLKKEGVIVFIEKGKKYPLGHYLIRTKRGWMNPWINFPNISPVKSGFQNKLPAKVQWVIYQNK